MKSAPQEPNAKMANTNYIPDLGRASHLVLCASHQKFWYQNVGNGTAKKSRWGLKQRDV